MAMKRKKRAKRSGATSGRTKKDRVSKKSKRAAELRAFKKQAGVRLKKDLKKLQGATPKENRDAVQALRMYQAELEMQNEELRSIQEELEASRDRYADLYECAPVGYLTLSRKGMIEAANLTLCRQLGYDRSALLKKPLSRFVHREDQDIYFRHFRQMLKSRKGRTCELRLRTKGGALVWAFLECVVERDRKGSVSRARVSVSDITEHKRDEVALSEREAEQQMLLKSMANAFVIFDSVFDDEGRFTSYRFVYINDAYERITGVKNDDVCGKTVHEVWPETEPEWIKRYGEVAVTGRTQHFELYHDPTKKLYDCTVYRPYPTPERFCVVFEDITERVEAERALQESEETYRTIFDAASDAIVVHDAESGAILDANAQACELYGYSVDELKHMSVGDVSSGEPGYTEQDAKRLIGRTADGAPQTFEWHSKDHSGRCFWSEVALKSALIRGRDCILAIVRDITERKAAEERLRRYSEELQEMVEARTRELDTTRAELFQAAKLASLGRMGAGIAHQLNSPLCGAMLLIDALLEREIAASEREHLQRVRKGLTAMRDIIEAMLSLAMVHRRGGMAWEEIDLRTVIANILGVTEADRDARRIALHLHFPDAFPAMTAFPGEIDQAFMNLINNAIDAMPEGGTLTIEGAAEEGHLIIRVADTGRGIAPEHREYLFDPFFTTRVTEGGLGLGLALTHQIVTKYKGEISVESELGRGTIFTVRLPLSETDEPMEAIPQGGEER